MAALHPPQADFRLGHATQCAVKFYDLGNALITRLSHFLPDGIR